MLDVRRCLDHLVRNYKFVQSDPADVARHDRMALMVEQMLALHKQLPKAGTPHEKTALERQIEATDGQIDALVYELYGLTEEVVGIVETAGS